MEGFRRSSLKVSLMLTIFIWGWQAQAKGGGGDLIFVSVSFAPDVYVARADTLNFTLIPGLDDHSRQSPHIGYDPVDGMVYLAAGSCGCITRAFLNGTGKEVVVNFIGGIYGMNLDVQNRVMYWTSSSALIERATFDGQNREVVMNLSSATPTGILVDPTNSHLYWTEVGENARIQRAATDGSGTIVLVDTDLLRPYSLALDLRGGRLYWSDQSRNLIESSDLQGQNRAVFVQNIKANVIVIYNKYMVLTSQGPKAVLWVNLMTANINESLSRSFESPFGLHVYKDTGDCSPNPCINGGNCTDGESSFTCACAAGFEGLDCATNTDDCSPNPCMNNGTCIDGVNGFACDCMTGFTDSTCSAENPSTVAPMPTTEPTQGEFQTVASTAQPLTEETAVVIAVVCVGVVLVIAVGLALAIWYRRRHTATPQPSHEASYAGDDHGEELQLQGDFGGRPS